MKIIFIAAQILCHFAFVASVIVAQEEVGLRQLAQPLGTKIGFEISPENLSEQEFCDTLKREASVGTMTAYWYLPDGGPGMDRGRDWKRSKANEVFGTYDFSRPKSVADFCVQNGIEIHGHPIVWARDRFTPPWVLFVKGIRAESLLKNHVSTVVTEFKETVHTWHVVNEVFDYEGKLVDCHWNRVLGLPNARSVTPRYVDIAFQAAANADPDARLVYNDYGQEEVDARKFNAILKMMISMKRRGIPIHGFGWQMHVTATQVLDPNFPLEARLNMVAQAGFDNYITEFEIVMDERNIDGSLQAPKSEYLPEDLARQAAAYQKITEIFVRAERGVSLQFWGVSDKQSWMGAERMPLIFDRVFSKKPAYEGVKSALSQAAP